MRCWHCDSHRTTAVDSRPSADGAVRVRRYKCLDCDKRFTSLEVAAAATLKTNRFAPISKETAWTKLKELALDGTSTIELLDLIKRRLEDDNG